jgi:hypothetical protein
MIQPTVSWRAGRPRPGGADGCRSRLAPSPNYFMGWRRSMVDVPRPVAIMRRSVGLCGGIGRRGRLKICFLQGSGGSSPSRGTKFTKSLPPAPTLPLAQWHGATIRSSQCCDHNAALQWDGRLEPVGMPGPGRSCRFAGRVKAEQSLRSARTIALRAWINPLG